MKCIITEIHPMDFWYRYRTRLIGAECVPSNIPTERMGSWLSVGITLVGQDFPDTQNCSYSTFFAVKFKFVKEE